MKGIIKVLFFVVVQNVVAQSVNHWETVVMASDTWQYFVGKSAPVTNWNTLAFSGEPWLQGPGGIGFGDGDDATIVAVTTSVYMRKTFTITDLSVVGGLALSIDYDDGFVAYINGVEVARNGVTGTPPAYNTLASISHEALGYAGGPPEFFAIPKTVFKTALVQGENVLAVEVHNQSATSSDLSAIPYLSVGISNTTRAYREVPSWFVAPVALLSSSNLPIVIIDTENQIAIPDEPKVKGVIKVIDNGVRNSISDSANLYNGTMGIEVRGRSSQRFPQKSYGFETRLADGSNHNVPFWNMPKENDWILTTHYNDRSFARNILGLDLFEKMGHYSPRRKLVEVIVNDDYQGIYMFTERIKADKGRVDIAKLDSTDISGDKVTGGYIFKVDYFADELHWTGKFSPIDAPGAQVNFVYHDPAGDDLLPVQKTYIADFVTAFETALYGSNFKDSKLGFRAYVDTKSFIDYFILSELNRNVDAYKKSKYYHKGRNSKGGLLYSGPAWDFDWAWKSYGTGTGTNNIGWAYKVNDNNPSPTADGWLTRMVQDPYFKNDIYNRYVELRKSSLSNSAINACIDSVYHLVNAAQVRHYEKWKTLGTAYVKAEMGSIPTTYKGEVDKLKAWIEGRLSWLDPQMQLFYTPGLVSVPQTFDATKNVKVFPNPASQFIYIESAMPVQRITIFDGFGKPVMSQAGDNAETIKLQVQSLTPGVYFVKVETMSNQSLSARFIKIN